MYIDYVRRSRSSSCRFLHPINCQTYITLHYIGHARRWVLELFNTYVADGQMDGQKQCLLLPAVRSGHNGNNNNNNNCNDNDNDNNDEDDDDTNSNNHYQHHHHPSLS